MFNPARRAWLSGDFGARSLPLRPPGAGPEARFAERCERCDRCIPACPQGILLRGAGGYPELDLRRGACTFCGACAGACPRGALRPAQRLADRRVQVDASCLAARGVSCRSCAEPCAALALRFRVGLRGRAHLEIDSTLCTGCGACIAACPAAALRLVSTNQPETATHVQGH